jgi:hypothetical protein
MQRGAYIATLPDSGALRSCSTFRMKREAQNATLNSGPQAGTGVPSTALDAGNAAQSA